MDALVVNIKIRQNFFFLYQGKLLSQNKVRPNHLESHCWKLFGKAGRYVWKKSLQCLLCSFNEEILHSPDVIDASTYANLFGSCHSS